ncbi:MAG: thermonuclease family protein [Pyrinomonadaceae bacterium]|nr:thermonuclease family protein [Pyrinomonadaceae bacterium]
METRIASRFLLLFVLVLVTPWYASSKSLAGRVVAIADGDTITILDIGRAQHRIRLTGIDAPESRQAFGTVSKQNLSRLIFGKLVIVEYNKLDKYGRVVGKVILDGRDICLEQVRAGLAWHYKQYEAEQDLEDRRSYGAAERAAREQALGLWKDVWPTPPWDFRRGRATSENPARPLVPVGRQESTARQVIAGPIIGNRRSMIFHWPTCPNYNDVSPHNRVFFPSPEAAEAAGYRAARNCPR